MRFIKVFLGLLIIISSNQLLYSQSFDGNPKNLKLKLSHPLKFGSERKNYSPRQYDGIPDTFTVVGILVQFQIDNSGLTSGNGQFDLSNKYFNPNTQRDTVIDAHPYDSAYFADHLKFLKNYFEKVSDGQTVIKYDLYGQVLTMPQQMQEYSPRNNENLSRLGNLFNDAWTAADNNINFSIYDEDKTAFVIFHAGVGRDIDLASILGFDPTPFDLPSVYLGLNNLKDFFGQSYNGFQTNDGFFVKNSLIIPSTELRELNLISGTFLLELGMNGILCANFGSFLGLPDLFNTETGRTGIGRFGLMDGQGIFTYNGICPPEPCAWSKTYLGWVNPITISSGDLALRIKNSSSGLHSDSTMFKVLISSKEYFLVENRNRDETGTGQTVHMRNRNFTDSLNFLKDTDDFNFFDITALSGNITDVKTPDWGLPGLINDTANFKGGIMIWHIDENVIDANISSNTINNNINHRGVALMEAKGAQTIGVSFNTPFGEVVGDGTIYDYWFDGNHGVPSTVYQNQFTPTTFPNTLSYSLANNNIFFTDFSPISGIMTFNLRIGSDVLSPVNNFPRMIGIDTTGNSQPIAFDFGGSTADEIFVNNNNRMFGFNPDGSGYNNTPQGLIIPNFGKFAPANIGNLLLTVNDNDVGFFTNTLTPQQQYQTGRIISTDPTVILTGPDRAVIGFTNGTIGEYSIADSIISNPSSNAIVQLSKTSSTSYNFINTSHKFITTGNIVSNGSVDTLIVDNSNKIVLNGNTLNLNYSISSINQYPTLADVNKDGRQEILLVADGTVYALNSEGVLLENFPVNFNKTITSGISVADVNADGNFDLLFTSSDGNLYAYGTNGKIVNGFPILVGPNTISTPAFANLNDTLGIFVFSGDGYLYGFKTQYSYNSNNILWKNFARDQYLSNNNFISINNPPVFAEKLPKDKVYNWPNPVYDEKTYIRYYINGNAGTVTVKILDLSGELVTTLNGTSISNADNEIIWNVSEVQSGVYYGVIEADIDGSTETRIIKIAVVK